MLSTPGDPSTGEVTMLDIDGDGGIGFGESLTFTLGCLGLVSP